MALTGFMLVGFVIAHMIGNLLVFAGQNALNSYAQKLQDLGALLWVARLMLLAAVLLHIVSGLRLAVLNRQARPVRYASRGNIQTGLSGRTMALSGLVLLAFIVYHLLHFTWGVVQADHHGVHDPLGRHDVYRMVVLGFQDWRVATSYIIAMLLLGMHLSHGVQSMFQSLGLTTPKYMPLIQNGGRALALLLVAGNVSMPLAILLGFVKGVS